MSSIADRRPEEPDAPAAGTTTADLSVPAGLTRLHVNINADTKAALGRVVAEQGVTCTEAVRRLCGYGDVVYATVQDGGQVLLRRPVDGQWRQQRLLLLGTNTPAGRDTQREWSPPWWLLVALGCLVAVVFAALVIALAAPHGAVPASGARSGAAPAPTLVATPRAVHTHSGGGVS